MTPKVSVLISSYNFGRYIGTALESVRLQTHQDFEAVVVDDGSTDDSLAVIGRYLDDDRFRLVRQRHVGQARAKNRGIEESRGEFIAFLDADDYWLPHKLERQLRQLRDPGVGVVFSRRTLIDEEGQPFARPSDPMPSGFVLNEMFRQNFVCFSTAMIRRQVVEHVGWFDERLDLAIDYDFWLRAATHYDFAFVDEPLAAYRIGHANLSRRQLDRLHFARFIMERFRERYDGKLILDPQAVGVSEAETWNHLSVFSRGYSRSAATRFALKALALRPLGVAAWRSVAMAMLPRPLIHLVRRLLGRDGSWEQFCHTATNRPETIL
jgi:glycosyltransferase involved in cell wall biosynthesis